jgi:HEAT repeat protein
MAASKDKDPNIRQMAIQALGQIEDAGALTRVSAALADPDQDVRLAAVRALGKMGNPGSVESLISVLGDSREIVRTEAVWALRRLTGEDLGSDRERWKRWQRSQPRPVAVGPPE